VVHRCSSGRGQQRPCVTRMAILAALGVLTLVRGRLPIDGRAIGGRRTAGVDGMQAAAFLLRADEAFQGVDALLVLLEGQGQCGLCGRWHLVSPFPRELQLKLHSLILHGPRWIHEFEP
jgi:hypothetical protein